MPIYLNLYCQVLLIKDVVQMAHDVILILYHRINHKCFTKNDLTTFPDETHVLTGYLILRIFYWCATIFKIKIRTILRNQISQTCLLQQKRRNFVGCGTHFVRIIIMYLWKNVKNSSISLFTSIYHVGLFSVQKYNILCTITSTIFACLNLKKTQHGLIVSDFFIIQI